MDFTFQQYEESAQAIRARLGGFAPKVAMILGSGLGYLGDQVEGAVTVPYGEIPYFKSSTAPGHKGRLVFGTLEGQRVAVMQGRMHHYEATPMRRSPTRSGCSGCWGATPSSSPTPPAASIRAGRRGT